MSSDPLLLAELEEHLGSDYELLPVSWDEQPSPAVAAVIDMSELDADGVAGLGLPRELALIALVPLEQRAGFEEFEGLDDWIVRGAGAEELRARLANVLRRRGILERRPHLLTANGLTIDPDRYEVRVEGGIVELTFKEFELLRFLACNPGKVFSRQVLLDRVWGFDYYGGTRTVDVHIRRIRAKIETRTRVYIRTVRGAGYLFE